MTTTTAGKGTIEARAEALCNLWGTDPNADGDYAEALAHAQGEAADGTLRADGEVSA